MCIISFIDQISVDDTVKGRMAHQQFPSLTCDGCSQVVQKCFSGQEAYLR